MVVFAQTIYTALEQAESLARNLGDNTIRLENFIYQLLRDSCVERLVDALDADVPMMRASMNLYVENMATNATPATTNLEREPALQKVLNQARVNCEAAGKNITAKDVLSATFQVAYDTQAAEIMRRHNLNAEKLAGASYVKALGKQVTTSYDTGGTAAGEASPSRSLMVAGHFGSAGEGDEKPDPNGGALSLYCTNLTKAARDGLLSPVIGRDEEMTNLTDILSQLQKPNAALIGEAGVGKTAIAEGLALKIVGGDVSATLRGKKLMSLDVGKLVAGTTYRGEFEQRVDAILTQIGSRDDIILFIDEAKGMMGAGSGKNSALDLANMLKPALSRGQFRCILGLTYDDYRSSIEQDGAMRRRFMPVYVNEPDDARTLEILKGLRLRYETHHDVRFSDDVLAAIVFNARRHVNYMHMPDKAITLMDYTASRKRRLSDPAAGPAGRHGLARAKPLLTRDDVMGAVGAMTGRDISAAFTTAGGKHLITLEDELNSQVFDQEHAAKVLSRAVKRASAGLNDPEKPLGSYLFNGPTGVGKTEMTKQLGRTLGMELVRFDMSEYIERSALSRLIGAPPGYVGYEQRGLLTDAVDKNPHCVLLLDEIEKAHPDLFNVLLQVMDYGRLTDNNGKAVDFRGVILIMTTNAGAGKVGKPAMGIHKEHKQTDTRDVMGAYFSPEFQNRLDEVVTFGPLQPATIRKVAEKCIREINQKLAQRDKNLTIEASPQVIDALAEAGYDPEFGARPMQRQATLMIEDPLADKILEGDLAPGTHIVFDMDDNGALHLHVRHTAAQDKPGPKETPQVIYLPHIPEAAVPA